MIRLLIILLLIVGCDTKVETKESIQNTQPSKDSVLEEITHITQSTLDIIEEKLYKNRNTFYWKVQGVHLTILS